MTAATATAEPPRSPRLVTNGQGGLRERGLGLGGADEADRQADDQRGVLRRVGEQLGQRGGGVADHPDRAGRRLGGGEPHRGRGAGRAPGSRVGARVVERDDRRARRDAGGGHARVAVDRRAVEQRVAALLQRLLVEDRAISPNDRSAAAWITRSATARESGGRWLRSMRDAQDAVALDARSGGSLGPFGHRAGGVCRTALGHEQARRRRAAPRPRRRSACRRGARRRRDGVGTSTAASASAV